jgi:hypothetical protein
VAYEAGSNAHVDVLAAALAALALVRLATARTKRASLAGGALLGLAIATKLTPGLLVPAVLRRRPVAVLTAMAGAVAAVYLPHILAVGGGVLGYLPGYLNEEGYANGARFALLSWLVPGAWAAPVAVALLVLAALYAVRTAEPDRPWHAAATVTGAALLITAPTYPWYALLLVVLVALGARTAWLAVAAAGYLAQYPDHAHLATPTAQRLGYGIAVLVLAASAIGLRVVAARGDGEPLEEMRPADGVLRGLVRWQATVLHRDPRATHGQPETPARGPMTKRAGRG